MTLKQFMLWCLAGGLIGSAHLYATILWPQYVLGFSLFLWLSREANSWKSAILGGALAGVGSSMCVMLWYWHAYPLPSLGEEFIYEQFFLIGVYWFYSSILLGVSTSLFSFFAYKVGTRELMLLLCAPFVWLGIELLGLLLYSLGTFGKGGLIGFNFGFGLISNVFSQVPFFIYGAVLFGALGLSVLSVFVLVNIFVLIDRLRRQVSVALPTALLVGVVLLIGLCYLSTQGRAPAEETVIAVETYFSKTFSDGADSKLLHETALKEAITEALHQNPDVILLPEDSRFFDYFDTQEALFLWLHTTEPSFEGVLVDSGRVDLAEGKAVLRANVFDTSADLFTYTEKRYLVPQGEYISYVFEVLLPYVLNPSVLASVTDRFAYVAGEKGTITRSLPHTPTILFCSENVVPFALWSRLREHRSTLVVHPVSHSWFREPHAMWRQLDAVLAIQAVWNRVPIVSASNMGKSRMYLPNGEVENGEVRGEGKYWSIKRFDF